MFLDHLEGIRAEELCVYSAAFSSGHTIDISDISKDSPDLLLIMRRGTAALCYDGAPFLTIEQAACFPHTPGYSLQFMEDAEAVLLSFRLYCHEERLRLPRELALTASLDAEAEQFTSAVSIAGPAGELRRKAIFFSLLSRILPKLQAGYSPKYSRIAKGVAALEAQFLQNEPISLYAQLCGIRENRFRALFTEQYGVSPVEYRNTLRMHYARSLMDRLHCSVAEAARASGFSSVSYFCRLHRKMFGISPAESEESDGKMDEVL